MLLRPCGAARLLLRAAAAAGSAAAARRGAAARLASAPAQHSASARSSSAGARSSSARRMACPPPAASAAAVDAAVDADDDGPPLFTFAVLSDVQYADIPDGASYGGTPRYYRHALEALREAVADWRPRELACALHLGDILDGFCPKDESEAALRRVLDAFDALPCRTHHCLGNHCLYNLPRATLNARLGIPSGPDGESYYAFSPHPGFRVVMMDSYDVSVLGWPEGHPHREAAVSLLAQHNPNANKNSPEGLVGLQRRFVAFGGGVSAPQLAWLRATLAAAAAAGERVFVCGHLPVHPDSCASVCLLWNYEEVLAALREARCVVATLAGHTHRDGHCVDDAGVHHRVLASVLECPPGTNAYGHVDVWPHAARLRGVGHLGSTHMPFRALTPAPAADALGDALAALSTSA